MTNNKQLKALIQAIMALEDSKEAQAFLEDLCTPQELEDFCLRWKIVDELKKGYTYREINDRTKASLTTIGRIAKALNYGSGGYEQMHARLHGKKSNRR